MLLAHARPSPSLDPQFVRSKDHCPPHSDHSHQHLYNTSPLKSKCWPESICFFLGAFFFHSPVNCSLNALFSRSNRMHRSFASVIPSNKPRPLDVPKPAAFQTVIKEKIHSNCLPRHALSYLAIDCCIRLSVCTYISWVFSSPSMLVSLRADSSSSRNRLAS